MPHCSSLLVFAIPIVSSSSTRAFRRPTCPRCRARCPIFSSSNSTNDRTNRSPRTARRRWSCRALASRAGSTSRERTLVSFPCSVSIRCWDGCFAMTRTSPARTLPSSAIRSGRRIFSATRKLSARRFGSTGVRTRSSASCRRRFNSPNEDPQKTGTPPTSGFRSRSRTTSVRPAAACTTTA